MKYLVALRDVNNKEYICTCESTSLGGAEHVFLDKYNHLIKYAQAYSFTDSLKYLIEAYPTAETISHEVLEVLNCKESAEYYKNKVREYEAKVKSYEEQLKKFTI